MASNGGALGNEKLIGNAMTLWDTTMISLAVGATIAFCFWANARATGGDKNPYAPAVKREREEDWGR